MVLVVAGCIVTAVILRGRAAPDAVRLLPESDAVFYINLEPIRLFTDLGKKPPRIAIRNMKSSFARPDSSLSATWTRPPSPSIMAQL